MKGRVGLLGLGVGTVALLAWSAASAAPTSTITKPVPSVNEVRPQGLRLAVGVTLANLASGAKIAGLPATLIGSYQVGRTVGLRLSRADGRTWSGSDWVPRAKFPLRATLNPGGWSTNALPRGEQLPDGSYNLRVLGLDDAGFSKPELGEVSVDFTVSAALDVTPPVVKITTPAAPKAAFTSLACSGTAEDFDGSGVAKVEVNFDCHIAYGPTIPHYGNGAFQTNPPASARVAAALNGTQWSFAGFPNVPLGCSSYTFYATATDRAGKASTITSRVERMQPPPPPPVDGTAPSITMTVNGRPKYLGQPSMGTVGPLAEIKGTVIDNPGGDGVEKVEIRLSRNNSSEGWTGSAWAPLASVMFQPATLTPVTPGSTMSMTWSKTGPFPTVPSNTRLGFEVRASDKKGNTAQESGNFVIDTIAPAVTWKLSMFGAPVQGQYLNGTPSFEGNGTDDLGFPYDGAKIRLRRTTDNQYWSGTAWAATPGDLSVIGNNSLTGLAFKYYFPGQMPDGIYEAVVTVADYGGNTARAATTITIDRVGPVVAITTPSANETMPSGGFAKFSGTASDATSGVEKVLVILSRNGDTAFWKGNAWGPHNGLPEHPSVAFPATLTKTDWQFTPPPVSELAPATYNLRAMAFDKAGNSNIVTTTFTVPATPAK